MIAPAQKLQEKPLSDFDQSIAQCHSVNINVAAFDELAGKIIWRLFWVAVPFGLVLGGAARIFLWMSGLDALLPESK